MIVFDLDGTLIDSAPDIHVALNVALQAVGRASVDLATTISFVGDGPDMLVRRALKATGDLSENEAGRASTVFLEAYRQSASTLTMPYPGVMDTLRALKAAGMSCAICTNKPQQPAEDICDALKITPLMTRILGSVPERARKPDPTPLLEVLSGADPGACLYVGDSLVDKLTAEAAGVPFVLFTGGYLNGTLSPPAPRLTFEDWRRLDPAALVHALS